MPNKLTDVTDNKVGKITDTEIKKALECSVKDKCPECPYFHSYPCDKCREMRKDALDLINRQEEENKSLKAEVERLKSDVLVSRDAYMSMKDRYEYEKEKVEKAKQKCIDIAKKFKTAKAEAYKEFAEKAVDRVEKARRKYQRLCKEQGEEMDEAMNIHFNGMVNLLNELVGDGDGN